MSTQLGHTRYRVWVINLPMDRGFEVRWMVKEALSIGTWRIKETSGPVTRAEAARLRDVWIAESLRYHAEEYGAAPPTHIDQSVKKAKAAGKVKPPEKQGGLF